jgi:hypothetical protein
MMCGSSHHLGVRAQLLAVGKSRDKVVALPEFAILAVYKLPRLLDGLFLVLAFETLYGFKVSIIPKSINTILVHGIHSASSDGEGGVGVNVTILPGPFSCVCKTSGPSTPSSPAAAWVQSLAKLTNCLRCSSVRALAAHRRQSRAYM